MQPLSPQSRFLLRGSTLLVALLTLWWFVLSVPMLAALRFTVQTAGGLFFGGSSAEFVQETSTGDWTFHVPFEAIVPATPSQPASQIHSVDFDLVRKDVNAFTFSLPIFWAIVLAAPNLRRNLRTLALGSAIMAVIELLLLMLLVDINARSTVAQLTQTQTATGRWLLRFGEYMIEGVIPFAAPFVLALSTHRDLRRQILGEPAAIESAPSPQPAPKPKPRHSRK